jgi:2-polyprenyl-3-methyl-5-hydroxy-6-metoxy-1,4-benzoquinol methylase
MTAIPSPICTICGASTNAKKLYRKDSGKGEDSIEIFRCGDAKCDTVFLGNCANAFDDGLYDYYKKYAGLTKGEVFDPITRTRYLELLERFASYGVGGTILDVGCGKGDFVEAATSAGWVASGIELSQSAIDVAVGFGLPVRKLDFFSHEIKLSSLDVVTMFEVIEHVANPGDFLRRAEEIVRPGGLVYLTTPNFDSLDRRILGINWKALHREHVNYFTAATLRTLIGKSSQLELVSMETRNVSMALLQRLRPRFGPAPQAPLREAISAPKRDLRGDIERSRLLMLGKRLANELINITSLGSTIVVLLRKAA